jgi:ribosomal protein S18 acetylase RimI-like enzyme
MVNLEFSVRTARTTDQTRIANLIYFEPYIHRHLDWRTPLDWLGIPEYWVIEQNGQVTAALACPPDPENVAWVRFFTHIAAIPGSEAWGILWKIAKQTFADRRGMTVAAIALQPWFKELLQADGFKELQQIVLLEQNAAPFREIPLPAGVSIRSMNHDDLPAVAELDAESFAPLWQNSLTSLQRAYVQAGPATVAILDDHIVGYQISTKNPFGVHLARLAVHPNYQGRGLGYALVQDLLQYTQHMGIRRVSVNTQSDNQSSRILYQKIGFVPTGERYPVFTYPV